MAGSTNHASSSTGSPLRVVLADDECLFRASLRQLLGTPPAIISDVYGVDVGAGFDVVGEAGSGEDTIAIVERLQPDLLLLDLCLPRMSGMDALRAIGPRQSVRTIVLSGDLGRADLVAALNLGARGLLLKDAATTTLFEAVSYALLCALTRHSPGRTSSKRKRPSESLATRCCSCGPSAEAA